ncbi:Dps family protein [Escherichia coli]|uniref:Dps family protein n=1 Tax=Escherichia coli TaxID=562 RepID=UPI000B278598|nr:ferritin-like domain-containing protein [Escherichia coli]
MSKQIIDIGIAESSRVEIADGLSRLLADTYTLYIKTHYYHWNVTGPMFNSLHLMFENQYNELPLPLMISLNVYARSDASRPAHIMNFHV